MKKLLLVLAMLVGSALAQNTIIVHFQFDPTGLACQIQQLGMNDTSGALFPCKPVPLSNNGFFVALTSSGGASTFDQLGSGTSTGKAFVIGSGTSFNWSGGTTNATITINGTSCPLLGSCSVSGAGSAVVTNPSGSQTIQSSSTSGQFNIKAAVGFSNNQNLFNVTDNAGTNWFSVGLDSGGNPIATIGAGAAGFQTAAAFISNTANPAATGSIRLASGDSIKWRNNGNTADLPWSKSASDIFSFPQGGTTYNFIGNQSAFGTTSGQRLCTDGTNYGASNTTCPDSPDVRIVPAANCNNSTAGAGWSIPSSSAPTVACNGGTNNLGGVLQYADGQAAQFDFELPGDWDTTTQPYINLFFGSGSNTTGTVIFTVATACTKADGSVTSDPAFTTADSFATKTMAAATRGWSTTVQMTQVTSGNNCVPGGGMIVKISRTTDTASSTVNVSKAVITIPRKPVVQAN